MNKFNTEKKIVPIDHIVPNRWNPNVQSGDMFKKGVASVEALGMLGSILVRKTAGVYEILDGEHRWRYMKELGYTECPVEDMGEIEDSQAQLLTVLLNNLRGKDDVEKRAKIYEALDEGQLQLLPFSQEEIANEKALFKFDFSKYKDKAEPPPAVRQRSFLIACSEDEYKVIQKALYIAKEEYKQEPLQWIMEQVDNYLAIHLGRSAGNPVAEFEEDTTKALF